MVHESGAIVMTKGKNGMQVLLIRSKKNPSYWIFPKGHIEGGESEQDAAVRESKEEAGADGCIIGHVGTLEYDYKSDRYRVSYYAMKFTEQSGDGEPGREPRWCSVEEAERMLSFSDTKSLLYKAVEKFATNWND